MRNIIFKYPNLIISTVLFFLVIYVLILSNNLAQLVANLNQDVATIKLRGDKIQNHDDLAQRQIDQLNDKYRSLETLMRKQQLVEAFQESDLGIAEEGNIDNTNSSINDNEQSNAPLVSQILDAQSKLVDNKNIVVNVTPEQREKFEELNAVLNDPSYVSAINMNDFIQSSDIKSLPLPLQIVLMNKIAAINATPQ